MPYFERTVQSDGITIDTITYYADILSTWVNAPDPDKPRYKRKFTIRRDPRDISVVYFLDPELNIYFPVSYSNLTWPATTIWEFMAAKERAEEKYGRENVNTDIVFQTYEEMHAEVVASAEKTKSARKALQRRSDATKAPKPKDEFPPPETTQPAMLTDEEDEDEEVFLPSGVLDHDG